MRIYGTISIDIVLVKPLTPTIYVLPLEQKLQLSLANCYLSFNKSIFQVLRGSFNGQSTQQDLVRQNAELISGSTLIFLRKVKHETRSGSRN